MEFTEEQISRYSRHILLPEVGGKGQKKIAKAKILLVGAGGLGSPAALYLAAAGVGGIGLIDSDVVDLTNLQRQILHHTPDVGRPKVLSGKEKIQALNPDVAVSMYEERLTAGNALKIFSEYDVIIDGVDNFTAKFLINDACFLPISPWFMAAFSASTVVSRRSFPRNRLAIDACSRRLHRPDWWLPARRLA